MGKQKSQKQQREETRTMGKVKVDIDTQDELDNAMRDPDIYVQPSRLNINLDIDE